MAGIEPPYFPIIYVRGYAGNDDEIEETVADPYMGFNIGATKFRQLWTGNVRRHYFESPLYRFAKDFGYTDVYSRGQFMPEDSVIPAKCIVVYRYYDEQFFDDLANEDNGDPVEIEGERRDIEHFAEGLSRLILRLQSRVCGEDAEARKAFRVYLVAHSMGGLVVRCFLQNPTVDKGNARALVDKVFTYATPHNGIDIRLLGNVPNFFSANNVNNFNRKRMVEYLALSSDQVEACDLDGKFDPDRFFCLVGTNWKDYLVAGGWSKRLTGPMSDGLVRIPNATVRGEKNGEPRRQAPRAYVHRSHSGHFGIVNSEEGYQNLTRFLFGDVRVDGSLELDELSLPKDVQKAKEEGKTIRASYHFEAVVRVRGVDWDLHRRTAAEESAVFRTFDEMFPQAGKPRNPHLFSTFLSSAARVKARRASLGFAVDLAVLVPEYVVDGFLFLDQHYKGSYLFRDTITLEATPLGGETPYRIRYGFDSRTPNRVTTTAELRSVDGEFKCEIPLDSGTTPGLKGRLVLKARAWK